MKDAAYISETLEHHCCMLQIIQEADKVYGVIHSDRISQIDVITRADALQFLQAEQEQHAAQQEQLREQQQQRRKHGQPRAVAAS